MASQSSSSEKAPPGCCPEGSIGAPPAFQDQPNGLFLSLGPTETPCYYVGPESQDGPTPNLGLILYTDVWGFKSRILKIADWLASEGCYHVLVCDCFRGETMGDHQDDKIEWLRSVPYDPVVAKDTQACLEFMLREKKVSALGSMGFCWGCWAIAKTCQAFKTQTEAEGNENGGSVPWKVAVCAHPSFKVESWVFGGDDVGMMHEIASACPLLLMPASNDQEFTKPDNELFLSMLDDATTTTHCKSILFQDMKHGWTTRGDLDDAKMKRDVDLAMQETILFLKAHLG